MLIAYTILNAINICIFPMNSFLYLCYYNYIQKDKLEMHKNIVFIFKTQNYILKSTFNTILIIFLVLNYSRNIPIKYVLQFIYILNQFYSLRILNLLEREWKFWTILSMYFQNMKHVLAYNNQLILIKRLFF